MPVHGGLLDAATSGGLPPISAGGGTSGDIDIGPIGFGAVNIGGVFSKPGGLPTGTFNQLLPGLVVLVVVGAMFFLRRKR